MPGLSSRVSHRAAENLIALRDRRPDVVLTKALQHSNSGVRILAAMILARLGNDAGASVLMRIAHAQDQKLGTIPSASFAMAALNSLGRVGYLPSLEAALESPDSRVHFDAAYALTSFPHSSTIPLWVKTWQHQTPGLRYWAFKNLIKATPSPDPRLLQEGLSDESPEIRLAAAEEILARRSDAQALDVAEGLTSFRATRNLAFSLLEKRGDPQRTGAVALQVIPRALEDDPAGMWGGVYGLVYALELSRNPEEVPALAGLLGTRSDWSLDYRVTFRLPPAATRRRGTELEIASLR